MNQVLSDIIDYISSLVAVEQPFDTAIRNIESCDYLVYKNKEPDVVNDTTFLLTPKRSNRLVLVEFVWDDSGVSVRCDGETVLASNSEMHVNSIRSAIKEIADKSAGKRSFNE